MEDLVFARIFDMGAAWIARLQSVAVYPIQLS
jgi:hypothetical protein